MFDDPLAVSAQDRIEDGEARWQTLGRVGGCVLVVVAHTVRLEDPDVEVIRFTSARRANQQERRRYEQGEALTDERKAEPRALSEQPEQTIDYSDIPPGLARGLGRFRR